MEKYHFSEINSDIVSKETLNKTFLDLGISPTLANSLQLLSFNRPTPIQFHTIPVGLLGHDIIAQSKAGTGKTLAYTTILMSNIDLKSEALQCLILLPTRELAIQVYDVVARVSGKLGKDYAVKIGLMIGGLWIDDDRNLLRQGVQIVIGTTGRIKGLIDEKVMNLKDLKVLVMDEADKLITSPGMKDEFLYIASRIKTKSQILAFSGTFDEKSFEIIKNMCRPEVMVVRLVEGMKTDIVTSQDKSEEIEEEKFDLNLKTLAQYFVKIEASDGDKTGISGIKNNVILKVLKEVNYQQAIIFYNDKGLAQELESDLRGEGILVNFIHGDQTQAERIKIMNKLKLKRVNVILATDLLSRGIDIENINLVINYDVPKSIDTYFHRVGRTGRFGKYGISLIFITHKDKDFLMNNEKFFVNIKELPANIEELNLFLGKNEAAKEQNEAIFNPEVTTITNDGNEKPTKPRKKRKEFSYAPESLMSDWKDANYQFYDTSKFKYAEEEEQMQVEENIIGQGVHNVHHEDESDPWGFLKCRVCYEFLVNSQQFLGKNFEILQYFQIEAFDANATSQVTGNE